MLKFLFVLFYVLLAAFVGAFADSLPKGRVMFIANLIKIFGCALLFYEVHPLAAYAIVGIGAAIYSPAKYGILTELLPPEKLVAANGWIVIRITHRHLRDDAAGVACAHGLGTTGKQRDGETVSEYSEHLERPTTPENGRSRSGSTVRSSRSSARRCRRSTICACSCSITSIRCGTSCR